MSGGKSHRNALSHLRHQRQQKNKPENDSRLLKNSEGYRDGERNFCREKELDNALFLQVASRVDIRKKGQKNLRTKLVDYYPKQNGHKQGTLKQRNKQKVSESTNHKP